MKKLECAKIAPLQDWLEDQVRLLQMLCGSRVVIINTGKRNRQRRRAAVYVLLAAKEREQCTNAPDVMWALRVALFSEQSHKSKFVIYHPIYE